MPIFYDKKGHTLKNHLGNVRVVISDVKIPAADTITSTAYSAQPGRAPYKAKLYAVNNYYAFGMLQPERHWSTEGHRYGFNGKDMDNEWNDRNGGGVGTGNVYDYGFRIYDPRLGRFMSVDPLSASYPWFTPYQFASNNPVAFIDVDGKEAGIAPGQLVFPVEPGLLLAKEYNVFMGNQYQLQSLTKRLSPYNLEDMDINNPAPLNTNWIGIRGTNIGDLIRPLNELTGVHQDGWNDILALGKPINIARLVLAAHGFSTADASQADGTLGGKGIALAGTGGFDMAAVPHMTGNAVGITVGQLSFVVENTMADVAYQSSEAIAKREYFVAAINNPQTPYEMGLQAVHDLQTVMSMIQDNGDIIFLSCETGEGVGSRFARLLWLLAGGRLNVYVNADPSESVGLNSPITKEEEFNAGWYSLPSIYNNACPAPLDVSGMIRKGIGFQPLLIANNKNMILNNVAEPFELIDSSTEHTKEPSGTE